MARISSIVRTARGSLAARAFACQDWSMHHPNLCIRAPAGIRTCALTALTRRSDGEVAFVPWWVRARARDACMRTTHVRIYVFLSETTYTTGVQQTRPVFRVKRERSEREGEREKETGRERGRVRHRARDGRRRGRRRLVRRGSRHEPNCATNILRAWTNI